MNSNTIIKSSKYTFDCLVWSSFCDGEKFICKHPKIVYAAYYDEKLVGFLVLKKSYYQANEPIAIFIELIQLEVHPNHRRRGIGTELVERMFEDYPNNNFYLECGGNEDVYSFYAKMGFFYFFKDEESGTCHFIKLIDPLDKVMQQFYKQQCFYPEENLDYIGCVWSTSKARFINHERNRQEEIDAIKVNSRQIYSVREQTLELQKLAIKDNPYNISLIKDLAPEIRELENVKDLYLNGDSKL
jgi:GNAT superfamily N-acetyltransferase